MDNRKQSRTPINSSFRQILFKNKLLTGGVIGTLAYIFIIAITIKYGAAKQEPLTLNELGDFLAGVFAPLAFLWLVLGFIQQGIELRQNSEALRLQVEELRQTAEHAGAMVKHANEDSVRQRAHDLHTRLSMAQPAFVISNKIYYGNNNISDSGSIFIQNKGHEAHIESITIDKSIENESNKVEIIRAFSGPCPSGFSFEIYAQHPFDIPSHGKLLISYTDQLGKRRVAVINFTISDDNIDTGPIVHTQFEEVEELLQKLTSQNI